MLHQLEFETELQFAIYTRINSLLFRKRISPLSFHIDQKKGGACYTSSLILDRDRHTVELLKKQIEKLVGVSHVQIREIR